MKNEISPSILSELAYLVLMEVMWRTELTRLRSFIHCTEYLRPYVYRRVLSPRCRPVYLVSVDGERRWHNHLGSILGTAPDQIWQFRAVFESLMLCTSGVSTSMFLAFSWGLKTEIRRNLLWRCDDALQSTRVSEDVFQRQWSHRISWGILQPTSDYSGFSTTPS